MRIAIKRRVELTYAKGIIDLIEKNMELTKSEFGDLLKERCECGNDWRILRASMSEDDLSYLDVIDEEEVYEIFNRIERTLVGNTGEPVDTAESEGLLSFE